MGEVTAPNGIRSFTPDDTDTEFYVAAHYHVVPLSQILESAQAKWGTHITIDNLSIEAEHIHTDCLGYDRYDAGDYTNYLRVELTDDI